MKGEFTHLRQWWDCRKTQIKMLHRLILTGHVSGSMRDPEAGMVELEHLFSPLKIKDLLKSNLKANLLGARIQGALV